MTIVQQLESRLWDTANSLRNPFDLANRPEGMESGHQETTGLKKIVSGLSRREPNVCPRQYGAVIQEEIQW